MNIAYIMLENKGLVGAKAW